LTEYSWYQIQEVYRASGVTVNYDRFFCKNIAVATKDIVECSIPVAEPVPGIAPKKMLFTARFRVSNSGFQMIPASENMVAGESAPEKSIRMDEIL
jgi:hypothetical protein